MSRQNAAGKGKEKSGSELFFEKVLSQLDDYVCIWNRGKQCVYANDRLERLWGVQRQDYMWKTPTQLGFSSSGSRLFEENIAHVGAEGEAVIGRFPYSRPSSQGMERRYECVFNPVRDEAGSVEFIACVTRDVTTRDQALAGLEESERQYRLLFESLEEAFCLLEVVYGGDGEPGDFRVLKVNPAFQRHTGIGDPIGKSYRELVPDLEPHWLKAWIRVAKSGRAESFVQESAAMGRWYDACIYSLEGPHSTRIVLLFYDITRFCL